MGNALKRIPNTKFNPLLFNTSNCMEDWNSKGNGITVNFWLYQQSSGFLCSTTDMDEDAFVRNQNYTFFISNHVANGLKVKQLVNQPLTLKTLMQKTLVGLWVKYSTFSLSSSLKLNISTTFFFFGTTICVQQYLGQIMVTI